MELQGRIVTPDGVVEGTLRFGRHVQEIVPGPAPARWIVPGFIDLHVHGGDGGDVMVGEEGVRQACRFHAARGTTSMLPTTLTAPFAQLEAALAGIRDVMQRPAANEARVLGAHLEGPWISPDRLGAQPPAARVPESWEVERLLEMVPVRVVTLAPEIEGAMALITELSGRGVRVQVGHTNADAELAGRALQAGAIGFTHLFNAMTGMRHRVPGAAAAALGRAEWAEIIVDDHHVSAVAVLAALRAIPGLYAVSDAIPAAGCGDGDYRLGGFPISVARGVARTADGALAGSVATLDSALRSFVDLGLEVAEGVARVSTIPADYLDRQDLGRLAPGANGDVVLLDEELAVRGVWRDGIRVGEAA